jgi:hypothetical protein
VVWAYHPRNREALRAGGPHRRWTMTPTIRRGNGEKQQWLTFTSGFWPWFIIRPTVVGIIGLMSFR